jgi:hypothetical protein
MAKVSHPLFYRKGANSYALGWERFGSCYTGPNIHFMVGVEIITQPALYCRFGITTWNFTGFRQVWGPCRCLDSRHEQHRAKYRFHKLDRAIWRAEDSWDELTFKLKAFLPAIS